MRAAATAAAAMTSFGEKIATTCGHAGCRLADDRRAVLIVARFLTDNDRT